MSKQNTKSASKTPSSETSDSSIATPSSTPKSASSTVRFANLSDLKALAMDDKLKEEDAKTSEEQVREEPSATEAKKEATEETKPAPEKTSKCKKHKKGVKEDSKKSKTQKSTADDSDSDDSTSSDSDSSDTSDPDSSSDEDVRKKRRGKSSRKKAKKARRKSKRSTHESDDEDVSEESLEEDSEADGLGLSASTDYLRTIANLQSQIRMLQQQQVPGGTRTKVPRKTKPTHKPKARKRSKTGFSTKFQRVDETWDRMLFKYKLKESVEDDESEFAEFAFLVKRRFDWEGKYLYTNVHVKSKVLRSALADVMKDCKCVSLEAEEPMIDPQILFLYLEELRTHYKKTLKAKIKLEKKKKVAKKLEEQRQLLKSLVAYIDEDFADTKKTLYPLLKAGKITFELCWALFHPNEIAVTSCYGSWEEPRCFKIEYADKHCSMLRGEWYCIEGRYLEYDGKSFGYGTFVAEIEKFTGPRPITSLATYPLKYHADPEGVKKQVLARAEKFIDMEGMHFKFHKGLAFQKKKKQQVLKININGRVMIDPTSFRRINPNYPISQVTKRNTGDDDLISLDSDSSDDDGSGCCCHQGSDSDDDNNDKPLDFTTDDSRPPKYKYRVTLNFKGEEIWARVEVDANGLPIEQHATKDLAVADADSFTKDELLLTSPVVLGFAFSEKLWLEFTITGITDIIYNEGAFDSLVLPPEPKSIVQALVRSHKHHGAKTIDDVVQGKGKGLVAVLHGPPGTGKTLTAESISELLKCPLYMVSAGELGADPGRLEERLQQVLDMAHSWGAILLLDEADVFLEQRETHDIHRNALVSIFLRLLEYFQGILFLTTNRVQTFDSAFQSRIHVALRYEELTMKAKKAVWEMFIEMTRKVEGMEVGQISDTDLNDLARHTLNGRQIKNLVRTAQALALNEKMMLTMEHIKRALEVAETFDRDFKGGTGYAEAMRHYT